MGLRRGGRNDAIVRVWVYGLIASILGLDVGDGALDVPPRNRLRDGKLQEKAKRRKLKT